MCKVQTKLYDLLSCEEEDFLSKVNLLDRDQIELLVNNIKLTKDISNSKKDKNDNMK